jgi:serine/threonine-protein kinase
MNYLYRTQNQAMAETTFGFGDALASLVAQETAEALILEDTTALSVLVSDFAANPEIRYLHISDPSGTVQASTNPYLRGEEAPPIPGTPIDRDSGSVKLNRTEDGVLEFRVPIRFQARRVGQVQLGLDGSGLNEAARTTAWMLAIIFFAALLALAAGLAWMTSRQQLGLKRLAWGLKRLYRGQYEFRLENERRDEFSGVFRQFNRLAVRLDEMSRTVRPHDDSGEPAERRMVPPGTPPRDTIDLEADPGEDEANPVDDAKVTRLR